MRGLLTLREAGHQIRHDPLDRRIVDPAAEAEGSGRNTFVPFAVW